MMKAFVLAALCAGHGFAAVTYLTFLGRVTSAGTTGYPAEVGVKKGDMARYVFAVDPEAQGYVTAAGVKTPYKDTTVPGVGFVDYYYDSLYTKPLFAQGTGNATSLSLSGQIVRYDTGYTFTCAVFFQGPDTTIKVQVSVKSKNFAGTLPAVGSVFTGKEVISGNVRGATVSDSGTLISVSSQPGAALPAHSGPRLRAGLEQGGLRLANGDGGTLRVTLVDGRGKAGRAYRLDDRLLIPASELPPGLIILRFEGMGGSFLRAVPR
jgi:hypothetical protein